MHYPVALIVRVVFITQGLYFKALIQIPDNAMIFSATPTFARFVHRRNSDFRHIGMLPPYVQPLYVVKVRILTNPKCGLNPANISPTISIDGDFIFYLRGT